MSADEEARLAEQLARYLGGELAAAETRALSERIEREAEVRALFAEMLLHGVAAREWAQAKPEPARAVASFPARRATWLWPLAAAACAVLAALFWMRREAAPPAILHAAEVSGTVRWSGQGGRVVEPLGQDARLSGGTVETLSDDAAVTLAFRDGTRLTLLAHSAATIADEGQKTVHLRSGGFSADVRPQPAGRPMRIHTPTALMEVLGTSFEVDSDEANTRLAVNEGRVRLTRLTDGRSAEVPARHEALASLSGQDLQVMPRGAPAVLWRSDFTAGVAGIEGRWLPAQQGKAARVAAEPVFLPKTSRGPVTIHRVGLTLPWQDRARVEVSPLSRLRLRGHAAQAGRVEVMLACMKPAGGYAGNWFQQHEVPAGPWQIDLPVEQFGHWHAESKTKPSAALELRNIALYTINTDVSLEVESVEVLEK
jgi:hypothetical protein